MRFFRKRKVPSHAQRLTSNAVKDACQYVQHRWVAFMKKLDSKSSVRQKKWGLMVFCGFGCFYCCLILINTFRAKTTASAQIPTTPVIEGHTLPHAPAPRLSSDDTSAIRQFKAMLDSLQVSDSGRTVLKDLKLRRPGLLDSFYNIEKLIH